MIIIPVTHKMKVEAEAYAKSSQNYTSREHDFHEGGPKNAAKKMYEGKIGEKAFRSLLDIWEISYVEDKTGPDKADYYDFKVGELKIDVKTRTEKFHRNTLEMVSQFKKRPKDLYISAYYNRNEDTVTMLGCITAHDLKNANHPKKFGFKENYYTTDNQLNDIEEVLTDLAKVTT